MTARWYDSQYDHEQDLVTRLATMITPETNFDRGLLLPKPAILSLELLTQDVTNRVRLTNMYHERLRSVAEKCGASLASTWDSMSSDQRSSALKSAYPAIPERSRPNLEYFRLDNRVRDLFSNNDTVITSLLCPYINLRNLIEGNVFLTWFRNLAVASPATYTPTALHDAHVDITKNYDLDPLSTYGVILHEHSDTHKFGAIVADSDEEANTGLPVGKAKLVLDALEKSYSFMMKAVITIIPDYQRIAKTMKTMPESRMEGHELQAAGEWPSLAKEALLAPYRFPGGLEIANLCTMVAAQHFEAKQHRLSLERDPGYFVSQLYETETHYEGLISNCFRSSGTEDAQVFYDWFSASILLDEAYSRVLRWSSVKRLSDSLVSIVEKHGATEHTVLPDIGHQVIQELEYVLAEMIDRPLRALRLTVPGLPSMRDAYRGPPVIPESNGYEKMSWTLKAGATPEQSRIQRVLQLLVDEKLRETHGLHNLTEAAQMIANEDLAGPRLLGSWVVREISEAALISELIHEIKRFQPGAPWRQSLHEAAANNLMYRKRLEGRYTDNISTLCSNNVQSLDPSSLYHPDRPKSARHEDIVAWETQRRQVESRLDKLWMALHEGLGQANRDCSSTEASSDVPEAITFTDLYEMRTFELGKERVQASLHSPPAEVESRVSVESQAIKQESNHAVLSASETRIPATTASSQSILAESRSDLEEIELVRKTEGVHIGITPDKPAKFKTESSPKKPKRHHTAAAVPDESSEEVRHFETTQQPTVIQVDAEAFAIFDAMFSITSEKKPASFAWNDVLRAMTSISFLPAQLRNGSWSFRRAGDGRVCTCHEPHDSSSGKKASIAELTTFGRRLRSVFGLEKESFELRG